MSSMPLAIPPGIQFVILPVPGAGDRRNQFQAASGELVNFDSLNGCPGAGLSSPAADLGRRAHVAAEIPTAVNESTQGLIILEDKHDPEISDSHPQSAADLGHAHVGMLAGLVIAHQAVTVARSHDQEFGASIAEHAIAGRPLDSILEAGIEPIRLGQGVLNHLLDAGPLFGGSVSLRGGATGDQQNAQRDQGNAKGGFHHGISSG